MVVRRKLLALLLVGLASIGIVGVTSSPAFASGPIAYRQAGNHYSPMYGAPYAGSGAVVQQWLAPGERFNMNCWVDNYAMTGNYYSARWFYGQSFNHGWGWVHSSYIYYQWNVPHC